MRKNIWEIIAILNYFQIPSVLQESVASTSLLNADDMPDLDIPSAITHPSSETAEDLENSATYEGVSFTAEPSAEIVGCHCKHHSVL